MNIGKDGGGKKMGMKEGILGGGMMEDGLEEGNIGKEDWERRE